jgi:hypothetical protein
VRLEELDKFGNSVTSSGLQSGTFRFVAQRFNHQRYRVAPVIQFNSILYYLCAKSTATRPITDTAQRRYKNNNNNNNNTIITRIIIIMSKSNNDLTIMIIISNSKSILYYLCAESTATRQITDTAIIIIIIIILFNHCLIRNKNAHTNSINTRF